MRPVERDDEHQVLRVCVSGSANLTITRARLAGGRYDDAVVVVTADHGMSLRPGLRSRTPSPTTFADIASVPLLIKRPGQRDGRVATANVETVDILPTLADELEIGLPWKMDGSNAFMEDDTPRSVQDHVHP